MVQTYKTLCRRSVGESDAARCVDQYLKCLDGHDALSSTNRDKSLAHAYLASMRDPLVRVGEGADQGVWNFDSAAFQDITQFIRTLWDQ